MINLAWYEWFPDFAHDFVDFQIAAGNIVTVTVSVNSSTSGSVIIENNTTGKNATQSLTSTSPLCQTNAEWIVEDYEEGGNLVPLADFGTVKFTDAYATTKSGFEAPADANIVTMVNGTGPALADAWTDSTSVTITYQYGFLLSYVWLDLSCSQTI